MKIVNFSEKNSIINQYMAEIRDVNYQKNRLLFRNNIMRIGEFEAFELSKTLDYEAQDITTPLGISKVNVPTDKIVLATIFRAGLPFHNGFLNVFDHAGNAFVSAYREYKDAEHHEVGIHIEYLATPNIDGKTLIIAKGTTAETYFEANHPEVKLQKYDAYADAYNALLDGRGDAFSTDNTEVIAWAKSNPGFTVGVETLGDYDTIAAAVAKGNESLLNFLNEEIETLGKEQFFHKDYQETLEPVFGSDTDPDSIVVEGGKLS